MKSVKIPDYPNNKFFFKNFEYSEGYFLIGVFEQITGERVGEGTTEKLAVKSAVARINRFGGATSLDLAIAQHLSKQI